MPLLEPIARGPDRALAARALVYTGGCHERLGATRARQAYRQVIDQYSDQRAAVAEARTRLLALDRRAATRASSTSLRKLLSGDSATLSAFGGLTPDGRLMTLVDEDGRLLIRNVMTQTTRTAFALWPEDVDPAVCSVQLPVVPSPSGDAIAYACEGPGNLVEVRVARVARPRLEGRTVIRAPAGEIAEPRAWLDGSQLVVSYTTGDGRVSFALVALATGATTPLLSLPAAPTAFSLSPDRRLVAFDRPTDGTTTRDVFVASVGGADQMLVAANGALPSWSPDGKQILYVSDRTGTMSLWGQAIAAGKNDGSPSLLYPDLGRIVRSLGVTSAGSLVYLRQTGLVDVYVVELDEDGVARSAPRPVSNERVGANRGPAWSASGQLAYLTELAWSGAQVIGVRDLAQGSARRLVTDLGSMVLVRWAGDSHRLIAKGADRAGRYGLHLIDADSGRSVPVITVPATEETGLGGFQWDAFDERVLFARRSGRTTLVSRSVQGADEQQVFSLESSAQLAGVPGFAVSPLDGGLAWIESTGPTSVLRHRTRDGTIRDVLSSDTESFDGVNWWPDGRSVLLIKTARTGTGAKGANPTSAWRVDIATGVASSLGVSMESLRMASVSPDGRWLAFTAGEPTQEVWILEHFLPGASGTTWPLGPPPGAAQPK